jgi:hypothetical protein
VNGAAACGRVNPRVRTQNGGAMKLMADLDHMHLIDSESGRVL